VGFVFGLSHACALHVARPAQGALVELLGKRVAAGLACMFGHSEIMHSGLLCQAGCD